MEDKKIMDAMKCDRCGVLYENYADGLEEFTSIRTIFRCLKNGDSWFDTYDLCPECKKSFSDWLNQKTLMPCSDKPLSYSELKSLTSGQKVWCVSKFNGKESKDDCAGWFMVDAENHRLISVDSEDGGFYAMSEFEDECGFVPYLCRPKAGKA